MRTLLTLALLTLIAATVFAGGYQINEHGTKAMGMGGAFAAQASDPSAIFFNPAGLSFQKGLNIYVGTTLIAPTTDFSGPTPLTTTTSMEKQTFFPSSAYITYSMDNSWSFGIGFFNPYGLGTDWKNLPVLGNMKSDLRTYYINPTVSYRFSDQLSVGVGVSYILGTLDVLMPIDQSELNPLLPSSLVPAQLDGGTGNAFGFNVGIMFRPTKQLSVGASYRHFSEIEFEGDVTISGLPSPPLPASISGTAKAKLPMPTNAFVGVAYQFSDCFTLEADAQYVGWSKYKSLKFDATIAGLPPTSVEIEEDYDDSWLLRLGGEYKLDKLAIRAGVVYDMTPQPDKSVSPQLPDANRTEFVVGLGYMFSEHISADLAYQFIKSADRTVTAPVNDYPGTYKSSANLFALSVGLHF